METLIQKLRAHTGLLSINEVAELLGFHEVTLPGWDCGHEGALPWSAMRLPPSHCSLGKALLWQWRRRISSLVN